MPKSVPALAGLTLGMGLCVVLALTPAAPARAQPSAPFELVTSDEARNEQQAAVAAAADAPPQRMRSFKPTAPVIEILAPSTDGSAVPAPLRIELSFKPIPGSRVLPQTFRALYGVLKLDLTERLVRHATISTEGLRVDRAQMPQGLHRFVLQIGDDLGNVGEQELRVRVGQP